MSLRFELLLGLLVGGVIYADPGGGALPAEARADATPSRAPLRVCADPNNLPFSNQHREGFENRIAALVARDLDRPLQYYWWPQRRGFIRNTLKAGHCDVVIGLPTTLDLVLATEPYYRSTYVFVSRRDRHLGVHSLDDPALARLKIGIHFSGDDYDNPPAAQALAKRGLAANVVGYSLYGDYTRPDPPADLIRAVARGDVDLAIAWGPLAGFFSQRSPVPLELVPVQPEIDLPFLPFVFDIGAGVRRGDTLMMREVQGALDRHKGEIGDILEGYGVPLVGGPEP